MKILSSIQNPELKKLRLLFQKARERKKLALFVIEGKREIQKAIRGGDSFESVFIHEEAIGDFESLLNSVDHVTKYSLEASLFEKLSIRSGSEKIIAIAQNKPHDLSQLKLNKNSIVLVIEAPEKPGNIGALYRTAAAAKIDAVIIANPKTDFYNPNSIRSSLGGIFILPTAIASSIEVIAYLKENKITIATAAINSKAVPYDQFEYTPPCALVMGTESTGLDQLWLNETNQNLMIPMADEVDSLNLSVSAGILMYECQRKNKRF